MNKQITYPYVIKILQHYIEQDDKVLEIGCGAKQYRDFLPKSEYFGLDLPQSSYVSEEPEYPCSAENMPIDDNVFNCIFGVATFYLHMDPDKTFRECHRVLKPGGRLIAFDYKPNLLRRIKTDERYGHVQTWTPTEFSQRLISAGFKAASVENISRMVDFYDYPGWGRFTVRALKRALGQETSNWMIIYAEKE